MPSQSPVTARVTITAPAFSSCGRRQTATGTVGDGLLCVLLALALLPAAAWGQEAGSPGNSQPAADAPISYQQAIAPLLTKYCAGCHNADDAEGKFSVETYAELTKGGSRGPALLPGNADASRLVRMLTGDAQPKMPPEDSPQPAPAEVALLRAWIDAGAAGPSGAEPPRTLLVPKLAAPRQAHRAITSAAWSPDGRYLAIARFAQVELQDADGNTVRRWQQFPGKVQRVSFSADGTRLVAASGVVGLTGEAVLLDVESDQPVASFRGHRDTMYDARLSPDGKLLATCSYDRTIILWDVAAQKPLRTIGGHNGSVYALAFHPDGNVLATASGDETVKLWRISDGQRLDTLGQPLDEQYAVTFSPDGKFVVAGGADNRIRVWKFVTREQPGINPLVHARFAHEGAISQLAFSASGDLLVSSAEDRTVKVWETAGYTERQLLADHSDVAVAIALAAPPASAPRLFVGRLDGSFSKYDLALAKPQPAPADSPVVSPPPGEERQVAQLDEQEPNDLPSTAQLIEWPAKIKGVIDHPEQADADLFRIRARAGEVCLIEVNAARAKSALDSRIEVLDAQGQPVPRVLLQAVRDSYFTFRGKDSDTVDDFRVHNWQEMELNEYLYANGEVVKLWLYPRGPDSGFKVYPGEGKRYTYFDTTATSHALHEPCYIVRAHPPETQLIPNGLPVFPVFYENDDDALRKWGADSRLTFTAPRDGEYLVRIADVRGFGGDDFRYELTLRRPDPDFRLSVSLGGNPVFAGNGREFSVRAERIDGFDGPIRVELAHLPPGLRATSPLVIQAGHHVALGAIEAAADAASPTAEQLRAITVRGTARVGEGPVAAERSHTLKPFGELKVEPTAKLRVVLLPADADPANPESPALKELVIRPGETVRARVRVERNGHKGNVSFGKEDSGRNLPHGVFVDNIGLNGLLILGNQDSREFFITAAQWVPPTERTFHLRADAQGGVVSQPVLLRVVSP